MKQHGFTISEVLPEDYDTEYQYLPKIKIFMIKYINTI